MFSFSTTKFFLVLPLVVLMACQEKASVPVTAPVEVTPPVERQYVLPHHETVTAIKLSVDGSSLGFINYSAGRYMTEEGQFYNTLQVAMAWEELRNLRFHPSGRKIITDQIIRRLKLFANYADHTQVTFDLVQDDDWRVYLLGPEGGQVMLAFTVIEDWLELAKKDNKFLDKRLFPVDHRKLSALSVSADGQTYVAELSRHDVNLRLINKIVYILTHLTASPSAAVCSTPILSVSLEQTDKRNFSGRICQVNDKFYLETSGRTHQLPAAAASDLIKGITSMISNGDSHD